MRIALFYQHYHNPDAPSMGRLYAFLRQWAPRHDVTLLTSRARYDTRLSHDFDWVPPGVRLVSFDVPYSNAMNARQRLFAFARYAVLAASRGVTMPRPDVILGISTPLTAAAAAAAVARLRGLPWVFQVQDLWPDFPIQMGAIRQPWLQGSLYALERTLYRSAAHVITLSPDMAAHVHRHGIPEARVTTLVNGTDFWLIERITPEDVAHLRDRYGLEGKQVVLYAGTFGRCNDVPTLLKTARRLRHRDDVRFVFVGYGFFADVVAEEARRLPNVIVVPPQPRHRTFAWFKLADVSLTTFIDLPVLAANAPAKFFDSLGAGTPVVVTNAGWTKRFVETHGCGWYVPPSQPEALAHRLEAVLADPAARADAGRRGREAARRLFDREELARRTEHILQAACSVHRATP